MSGRRFAAAGLALLACLGAGATAARGAAAADSGRQIAARGLASGVPACGSCHGAAGEGLAVQQAPRLAGLDAGYLAEQLDRFASGARKNDVMASVAKALTLDERRAVAAYFARLPTPSLTPHPAAQSDLARGQALAERGDWAANVPACGACHGPEGRGVGAVTPPLSGQSQAYLSAQLAAFRTGARRSDTLGLMNGIAARLSPADLQAAAAYYASLPAGAPARTGAGR
ncbi:c-type cytochrome [Phenylobacterium sp.]|uniref:c-type cytochrome n=1 Tax=Phenylobacterium sp. TaxID=1871053 RepID=UPI00260ED960|nr:c-type cytochrome [Phenylobacterium sp.]